MALHDPKINTYKISRDLFDWSFENPDKIKPAHIAIYFFALDQNNRFGWKDKFGFPTLQAMEATGIKSKNTYYKAFHELTEWDLIEIVTKSKNQNTANVISIPAVSKFKLAQGLALGSAQGTALDSANIQQEDSRGNIDKQVNHQTKKQVNGKNLRALDFLKDNYPSRFQTDFLMKYKSKIQDKKKFAEYFNDKVDLENIEFTAKKLFARLNTYASRWIEYQTNPGKSKNEQKNTSDLIPHN